MPALAVNNVILNPPPAPAAIVISWNAGGYVNQYIEAINEFTYTRRRVEVRGECRSACTMILEVPTVCVAPGAVFRWHHAYDKFTKALHPEVTELMLSRLPPKISARLQGKIGKTYTAQASLDYHDLIELGVKDCDAKTTVATKRSHSKVNIVAAEPPKSAINSILAPFLFTFKMKNQ